MLRPIDLQRSDAFYGLIRTATAIILIIGIFSLDTFTSFAGAIAVLYVLPMMLLARNTDRAGSLLAGLLCAGLTLISFLFNHLPSPSLTAIMRMLVSLAANAITIWLIQGTQRSFDSLRASEHRHRRIINGLAIAIWEHDFRQVDQALGSLRAAGITDLNAHFSANPELVDALRRLVRITDVNQKALDLLGFEDAEDFYSHLHEFLPNDDVSFAEFLIALDARAPVFQSETSVRRRDGTMVDIIVAIGIPATGTLDRVVASILEVTERNRMAASIETMRLQLERAQRTTAIGQMSAMIAHEINQPLSAVRSYAAAASRWIARPEPDLVETTSALGKLVGAVDHVQEVIQRVRALSGQAQHALKPVSPDDLLISLTPLLQREANEYFGRVSYHLNASHAAIIGDTILLQQVIINLVRNAFQAMEDVDPCDRIVRIASSVAGGAVTLTVSDHGPGWEEEAMARLLEPFQTTRREGMGLGLAICRDAIQVHGGTMTVRNLPIGGAAVDLRIPLSIEATQIEAA
ncbi:sensor histidine kinase [Stakelama pacifica]|uniref:histidine kinase n=1 Tax=Stakelama pacifica TaxID=517720 RepID=A0A4R6FC07_9SPHN|nr:ATP-binding protein [Stakelama pacifica]TDN78622.1 PAS domain S-box-containing protein [Stakelama pacifica]